MHRENESFSDVIGKLTKKRKSNLNDYFGALKDSKVFPKDFSQLTEAELDKLHGVGPNSTGDSVTRKIIFC